MVVVRRLRATFEEWENSVPITLIATFALLGLSYWFGLIQFSILPNDLEKAYRAYVEIGIAATGAIFAIVITLSLVAIQFASQEYSHRIMNAYIKSVMFWATMVVYLGVMAMNVLAAMNLNDPYDTRLVGLSVVGSLLCLILLVPHFLITAAYLKPDFVMAKLLHRVDAHYLGEIQRIMERRAGSPPTNTDRLLPVVEMIERSIDKGDLTTTRTALDLIREQYANSVAPLHNAATDRFYLNHLLRLGHKAVLAMDEETTAVQVVSILGDLGISGPDTLAAEHIENLGSLALKRDSDRVVDQVIDSLRQIFTATRKEETQETILTSYAELVARLSTGDKERQVRHLVTVLHELAREALNREASALALRFLEFLERIGRAAAGNKRHTIVHQTVESVQSLGMAAATDPDTAERIVTVLLRIERDISPTERELRSATEYARGAIQYAIVQQRKAAAAKAPEPSIAPLPVEGLWSKGADSPNPRTQEPVAVENSEPKADGAATTIATPPPAGEPAPPTPVESALDLSGLWDAKPETAPTKEEALPPPPQQKEKDPFGIEDLWTKKD